VLDEAVLGGRLSDVTEAVIAGVPYLTFTGHALGQREMDYLANLSSAYALFRCHGPLLDPVELRPLDRFDDDLITIQKYPGKTNEHFTKLLVNVTLFSSGSGERMLTHPLRVLDPLCGRGTTLNQALMYGYHAAGLDLDGKGFEAYATFIRTWLRHKRLKHQADVTPVRRERKLVARRLHAVLASTKERYKAGEVSELDVVHADTVNAAEFFRPNSFDAIVTDAPYGVQHGARNPDRALARNPLDLFTAALPGWTRLLRSGGTIGISWNTYVARREELAAALTGNGLDVFDSEPYRGFRHRVDQAIVRDLIVARKP
jgi:SAM-dependent methyltransferase